MSKYAFLFSDYVRITWRNFREDRKLKIKAVRELRQLVLPFKVIYTGNHTIMLYLGYVPYFSIHSVYGGKWEIRYTTREHCTQPEMKHMGGGIFHHIWKDYEEKDNTFCYTVTKDNYKYACKAFADIVRSSIGKLIQLHGGYQGKPQSMKKRMETTIYDVGDVPFEQAAQMCSCGHPWLHHQKYRTWDKKQQILECKSCDCKEFKNV